MSSFQAKIGWKRQIKRENKNFRFVPFVPDCVNKIPKKQQKNSKNFEIRLWNHFKPKQVGKDYEREKIKIIVPLRSYPTGYRKFQKNSKKFKNTIMAASQAKKGWKRLRKREYTNYHSVTQVGKG